MKFDFSTVKKTDTVTIQVYESDVNKIRKMAEEHGCSAGDIYRILIHEALEDYEIAMGPVAEKEAPKNFSNKRDLFLPGDGLRPTVKDDPMVAINEQVGMKVLKRRAYRRKRYREQHPEGRAAAKAVVTTSQSTSPNSTAYCQNTDCLFHGKAFLRKGMYEFAGLLFHDKECAAHWNMYGKFDLEPRALIKESGQ